MNKKIFIISTIALILLAGAIFVYNFAFKKPATKTRSDATTKASTEGKILPSLNSEEKVAEKNDNSSSIVALSEDSVFGATLAPNGNSIYYFSGSNGQLNQIDFNGKLQKVVSTEEFRDIQQIFWNKQKNRVIIKHADDPNKSKFLLLDLTQKSVVTSLKDNIDSVAWSGLGDKLIYKYYDSKTKKRTLNISDPDGKNWRKLADISYYGAAISPVPGSADISFWPSPDAFVSSSVNLVSFNGESKKEILKDRFGTDLLWSPNGKMAAVSFSDQKGGHKTDFALMNSDGGQFHSLNFPTFAKKCVWSADVKYLFCAMPGNIPESAILPNDWQEGKIETSDTFWKIEVTTGKKERLIEADKIDKPFDVLNPFLSTDEKILFFINKIDGKLYKLGFS